MVMSLMTQNCDKRSPRNAVHAEDLSHHDRGNSKRLHRHAAASSRVQTKKFGEAKGTSAILIILFLVGLCSANSDRNPYEVGGMTKGMNFGTFLCSIGAYLCIASIICAVISSITWLDADGLELPPINLDSEWRILLGVGIGNMVLGTVIGMYFARISQHDFQWSAGAYGCLLLETVVVRSTAGLVHLGISVLVLPFLLCWWARLCFTYKEAAPLFVGLFMLFQGVYTVSSFTFCYNANKIGKRKGEFKPNENYVKFMKNRILTPVAVDKPAQKDNCAEKHSFQKKLKDFSMDKEFSTKYLMYIYLLMIVVNGLLIWMSINEISRGRWPIISLLYGIILPLVFGGFVVPWMVKHKYTAPKSKGSTYANKESEENEYLRTLTRESTIMDLKEVEQDILRQKSLLSIKDAITGPTEETDRQRRKCHEELQRVDTIRTRADTISEGGESNYEMPGQNPSNGLPDNNISEGPEQYHEEMPTLKENFSFTWDGLDETIENLKKQLCSVREDDISASGGEEKRIEEKPQMQDGLSNTVTVETSFSSVITLESMPNYGKGEPTQRSCTSEYSEVRRRLHAAGLISAFEKIEP